MRHIIQQHPRGCGPAALAMVTGHDYAEVCNWFKGIDFSKDGIHPYGIDAYLVEHGYATACKGQYFSYIGSPKREPWPPAPFAESHVCNVRVHESCRINHFVVMLEEGTVLDPLTMDVRRLSDYHEVHNVVGVYRVSTKDKIDRLQSLNAELLAALIEIAGYVPDCDTGGIGVTAEFTRVFEIARAAIARCEAGMEGGK